MCSVTPCFRQTKLPEDNKLPEVTLMICAYNEQDIVNDKMNNTLAIDYPKLKTVWVTDGSDDDTNLKLSSLQKRVAKLLRPLLRCGKEP